MNLILALLPALLTSAYRPRWNVVENGQSCDACTRYGRGCVTFECPAGLTCSSDGQNSTCKKPCTTACGKTVPHGWTGNDEGANYCNNCACDDGALSCTEIACAPRAVTCLAEADSCTGRPTECPTGTICGADQTCVQAVGSACETFACADTQSFCKILSDSTPACVYNCRTRDTWGPAKQKWCCANQQLGCQPCDASPLFTAPCPSDEYIATKNQLKALQDAFAGIPPTVLGNRASTPFFEDLGTAEDPRRYREEVIAGINVLILGDTHKSASDKIILQMHGGGYIAGSAKTYTSYLYELSVATGATVIAVDYKLAPEAPMPSQVGEIIAVYNAILARGVSPKRVSLVGGSAGGALVLLVLQKLRDDGLQLPSSGVALSPWTDLTMSGASILANAAVDPLVTPESLEVSAQAAVGNIDVNMQVIANNSRSDPSVSPLFGTFEGLPPLYFITGKPEILVDDTTRVVEKAKAAGVDVTMYLAPSGMHVFPVLPRNYPDARYAIGRISFFMDLHWE